MAKLLIVDDEQGLREMINIMMQKEGFETEMAEDGSDFLEKIDRCHSDLVTLDIMIPGLTIKEILEKLKEKESNPGIILLTVVTSSEVEKMGVLEDEDIVDYITMPFYMDRLVDSVKENL